MAFIYKITNNYNNKVYIGQTIREPSLRWNEHKSEAFSSSKRHGYHYHLHSAMRKYGLEYFSFNIIDSCPDEQRFKLETKYILEYHSNDPNFGYNCVIEGSGRTIYSSEEILWLWDKGLSRNEIANLIGADAMTVGTRLHSFGISHEEIVNRKKQEKWSEWQSKAVLQYTVEGIFIKEWPSATSCSIAGYNQSAVSNVCRQEQKSAYGFLWKYKEDERDISQWVNIYQNRNIRSRSKKIAQYDKKGKFIAQYNSAKEAADALGKKDKSCICRAARVHGISSGYKWEYV